MKELIIGSREAGQRLDVFLSRYLNKAPKSFIYKMLRKKNITLNGRKAGGKERLGEQDVIRLFLAEDTIQGFQESRSERDFSGRQPEILYEDHDILVLNKPAGLLSQGDKSGEESCCDFLITHMRQSGELTAGQLQIFRPSPCNRLDRNTSGIVMCGKSLKGEQYLSAVIRERSVKKYYLTIVEGRIDSCRESVVYGRKSSRENKLYVSPTQKEGYDRLITGWKTLDQKNGLSLLKVRLITGKPHQIRAHLAFLGHPVIGDGKYGTETSRGLSRKSGAVRQMLHAYEICLPSGIPAENENHEALTKDGSHHDIQAPLHYIAPPPDDFLKICRKTGLSSDELGRTQ